MDPREHPVHFTTLKAISQSPMHYLHALNNPRDSAPMRLGRLVHSLVLGGEPPAIWDGERRGNAWKEFQAANEHRDILTRKEMEQAVAIADAVTKDPIAAPFLVGETERAVEWEMFGRRCATRGLDVLGDGFITDLKTTNCSAPDRFQQAARRMAYPSQLAMYRDAARSLGRRIDMGVLIAVETKAPYAVTVHRLRLPALLEGEKLLRLWFERLLACEAANEWPGYTQSVVEFDLNEDFGLVIDGEEETDYAGAA